MLTSLPSMAIRRQSFWIPTMEKEKARILLARGLAGTCIVVATDSAWVQCEVDAISDGAVDLGIDEPEEAGLWLWTGELKLECYTSFDNGYEPETEYVMASLERAENQPELFKMQPPPDPNEDDREAKWDAASL
jgi:hypothetical protein